MPLTGITEAVFARSLSALRDQRRDASGVLAGPKPGGLPESLVDDIRKALYASKVVAYAQGFEQMAAAAKHVRLGPARWASWRRSGAAAASSAPAS